jgi:hypothetical protein
MTDTEKIMKRIMKKHPTAKLMFDQEKNLYVDINGRNLMDDHLLPPTKDVHTAWEMAELSLKMTQNFNRTHPLRVDMYSSSDKKGRIKKRRKTNLFDGFYDYDGEMYD